MGDGFPSVPTISTNRVSQYPLISTLAIGPSMGRL